MYSYSYEYSLHTTNKGHGLVSWVVDDLRGLSITPVKGLRKDCTRMSKMSKMGRRRAQPLHSESTPHHWTYFEPQ